MKQWQVLAGVCLSMTSVVYGFEDPCAKFGLTASSGDSGYAWRTSRCEGLFARTVSSALDIRLISFASGLSRIDPAANPTVKIDWAAPQGLPVQLRAVSLRGRHYYRMDVEVAAQQSSFAWPTDVLRRERLSGAEVGIVAIVPDKVLKDTYVPLKIQGSGDSLEMRLMPDTELAELKYSIDSLSATGKPAASVVAEKELGLGYYPPSRAFRIPMPAGLKHGYYRLKVGATAKSGGTIAKEFAIYVP